MAADPPPAPRVGIRVPACRPADEVADFLAGVERAGFAFAGLLDSQLVTRDVFVTLALAARATTRLHLYSAVVNPLTRHVSVLAGAARTVQELAPGRAGFFVGSGASSAAMVGRAPATLREMAAALTALRRLLAGDEVDLDGARVRLAFAGASAPPLYVAATGPRMLALAGELADGVLLGVGAHPRLLADAAANVAEGAARAGRDPADLELFVWARTVVGHDRDEVRRAARPLAAQWVVDPFRARWLRRLGLDVPAPDALPPELTALYPDVTHTADEEAAVAATAFLPDDLVDAICDAIGVFGTPGQALRRLRALGALGYRNVYLMGAATHRLPADTVGLYGREILPRLAAAPGPG